MFRHPLRLRPAVARSPPTRRRPRCRLSHRPLLRLALRHGPDRRRTAIVASSVPHHDSVHYTRTRLIPADLDAVLLGGAADATLDRLDLVAVVLVSIVLMID